ncbi:MAG: choline-sulfatase, partial [Pseudomonadota bacterium]
FHMADDPQELRDLAESEPDILKDGYARVAVFMGPEEVNKRAFQDQARRIKELGGPDSIRARGQFSYTPANA